MNEVDVLFKHVPHPRTIERHQRRTVPPPKVDEHRVGFNGKLGLFITTSVGTMWAAYLFGLLALVSLPSALRSGSSIIIVAWIAQTFLQLVLLPVIIVGQNIQAKASDARSDETFRDAEAILHEALQIQEHLTAQDRAYSAEIAELKELVQRMSRSEQG